MIQLNDERFWLYAAVDPDTNRLLHLTLSPTRNQAITEILLVELREKHLVDDVRRTLRVLMLRRIFDSPTIGNLRFPRCERDALRLVNALFLVDSAP